MQKEYNSFKEPGEVVMNCLLLLIILFCCGHGNNFWNSCNRMCDNGCQRNSWQGNDNVATNNTECGCSLEREREEREEDCGCDHDRTSNRNGHMFTAPPSARAQYPYLDLEPRTCGCEENK